MYGNWQSCMPSRFLMEIPADLLDKVKDTGGYISNSYQNNFALFIPGFRFQTSETGAFQFGFAGINSFGETFAVPFPYVQWFRKF
jgi:hypothetical protein